MKRILLVLMCIFLSACHFQNTEEAPKEKINFRITWKAYSGRGDAVYKIVKAFNAEQDKYEIIMHGGNEDLSEIRENLNLQSMDVYVLPYRYVQVLGAENKLMSIDLALEDLNISKYLLTLGKVNEDQVGLPWVSHSMALLYNKTLLEELDINPEDIKDRNSFIEVLKNLKVLDYKGLGLVGAEHNDLSWMINQFIYGSGGLLVEGDQVACNTSEVEDAIGFYVEELSQYAQRTWKEDTGVEVMDYFRNQEIVFEIQGPWGITDIWKNGYSFDVGVMPLNRIGANAEIGPMMLSMPKDIQASKKEVVLEFMNYMLSLEAQEMIMHGEYSPEHDHYFPFRLPVRKDVITSDSLADYQIFEPFIESYDFPSIDVPIPVWQEIKDELYTPGLKKVIENEISIKEFLETLEKEANKRIEAYDE